MDEKFHLEEIRPKLALKNKSGNHI